MTPTNSEVARYTDKYFDKTRRIVEQFGDCCTAIVDAVPQDRQRDQRGGE